MSEHRYTPGPWRWEVNRSGRKVQLVSYANLHGWHETIMDFVRWGMSGAAPRFRTPNHLMERCEAFAVVCPGREHHEDWHRLIDHPDARLIQHAPEYAEEVANLIRMYFEDGYSVVTLDEAMKRLRCLHERATRPTGSSDDRNEIRGEGHAEST